jgi:UPF0755 protein
VPPDSDPKTPDITHQPISPDNAGLQVKKWPTKRKIFWAGISLAILVVTVLISGLIAYLYQLSPRGSDPAKYTAVTIESGMTPSQIGALLEEKQVIRSSLAFNIYARLNGHLDSLQAGTYRLSPADSTNEIIDHLRKGDVDTYLITLFPGATLIDNSDTPSDKKYDVTTVLKRAGFSDQEISEGLSAEYESPVLADKPAGTSLEGYIYGETYQLTAGTGVKGILQRSIDQLNQIVVDGDLVDRFAEKGLSLYEGITLASIIQREALTDEDRRQVAQVFLLRLETGMVLGSDVTFIYAANNQGIEPISTLDSPYNTRIHAGLPPGPISSPSESALMAVADPADGDYLFFVAGDDGKTYYGHTLEEHLENVANHCTIECQKP